MSPSKETVGPIIGGVVGGSISLALVIGVTLCFLRIRKRRKSIRQEKEDENAIQVTKASSSSKLSLDGHESRRDILSVYDSTGPYIPHSPTDALVGTTQLATPTVAVSEDLVSPAASVWVHPSQQSEQYQPTNRDSVSVSLSPTEVGGLREDVRGLRDTMRQLQARRFECPPAYSA